MISAGAQTTLLGQPAVTVKAKTPAYDEFLVRIRGARDQFSSGRPGKIPSIEPGWLPETSTKLV